MLDFSFNVNLFLRQPLVTEVAAFGEIPSNIHRLTQQPPVTCVPVNVAPTSTHHLLVQLPVHLLVHLLVQLLAHLLVHLLVQEERVNFIKSGEHTQCRTRSSFFLNQQNFTADLRCNSRELQGCRKQFLQQHLSAQLQLQCCVKINNCVLRNLSQ